MNIRDIKYGLESLTALKNGLDQMADAVKVTLGPKGKNVVIQQNGKPRVTKDGVTVARNISLRDQFEDQGAQLALQTCIKSNTIAGDGTTTAIVLAQAFTNLGFVALNKKKYVVLNKKKYNAVDIKAGIELGTKAVLKYLKDCAREVSTDEQLLHVGNISSNGEEEISKIIVEAMNRVGENGVITYQETSNLKTELKVVDGYHFSKGYQSSVFCNVADKPLCELSNAFVLITNKRFNYYKGLEPYLKIAGENQAGLLIISEEVEHEAYAIIRRIALQQAMPICAVKAPAQGELREQVLEDIAAFTGGQVIRHEMGDLLDIDLNNEEDRELALKRMGRAKRIVVKQDSTTIMQGLTPETRLVEYCDALYGAWKEEENPEQKAILKERLSRLTKGVANILVGGTTEAEVSERKDRVEDALNACQAAKAEGILPGGGIALLRASQYAFDNIQCDNDGQKEGVEIVKAAIRVPLKQIIDNAGVTESEILSKILQSTDKDYGYDAYRNTFGNMYALGIIDPLRVVRSALEGASSIASLILTSECTIVDHIVATPSGQLSPQIII